MRVQAATALLAVVGLLRGSQLVAAAPPADAFELTVYTGAACATPVGDTIEGALARCLPLSSPAAAALGLVAIAVECSPDGTEGVVIPFADAGCENITAPPPVLVSAACTAVPPELLGAVGPTAVTGLVLTCGIPTPPTPPPTPSLAPTPVPVAVQLFPAAACGGGPPEVVAAGMSETCLALPATGGSAVVSCAPDNSEALLLLFAAPGCANLTGAPALLPATGDATSGACASDAESALGARSARVQCGAGADAGGGGASAAGTGSASASSAPSRSVGASGTASGTLLPPPTVGGGVGSVTPAGGATASAGAPSPASSGAASAARASGSALVAGLAVVLAVAAQQRGYLLRPHRA